MPTPNPLAPVKVPVPRSGCTPERVTLSPTHSLISTGIAAKIKELTPGEMTAESYDDTYLDDEDADWNATAQGQNLLATPLSPSPGSRVKKGKRPGRMVY